MQATESEMQLRARELLKKSKASEAQQEMAHCWDTGILAAQTKLGQLKQLRDETQKSCVSPHAYHELIDRLGVRS